MVKGLVAHGKTTMALVSILETVIVAELEGSRMYIEQARNKPCGLPCLH